MTRATRLLAPPALALALVASAVVLGCGGGGGGSSSGGGAQSSSGGAQSSQSSSGGKVNDHGAKTVKSGVPVDMELDNYYFEPTTLKGRPGEKVTLELSNHSGTLHNFQLSSQGVDQDVKPHGTSRVTVTLPKSGQMLFVCKYHAALGMRGTLSVSGAGGGAPASSSSAGGGGGY